MGFHKNSNQKQIAEMILNYLLKRPSSKDTLQGIAQWWILREQIDTSLDEVSKALDYLVAEKFVLEKRFENQEPCFELNLGKIEEIVQRLKKSSKD